MIAVATPGGVIFRDFETPDQRKDAEINAEAKAWAEARKPRCPTARQLLLDEPPATIKGGRDGQS